jgi:hypothetical protein
MSVELYFVYFYSLEIYKIGYSVTTLDFVYFYSLEIYKIWVLSHHIVVCTFPQSGNIQNVSWIVLCIFLQSGNLQNQVFSHHIRLCLFLQSANLQNLVLSHHIRLCTFPQSENLQYLGLCTFPQSYYWTLYISTVWKSTKSGYSVTIL